MAAEMHGLHGQRVPPAGGGRGVFGAGAEPGAVVTAPQTPSQVHADLVAAAKQMVAEHWPNDRGCPICKVPICEALQGAVRYLEEHADPAPAPIIRAVRR